MSVGDRLAELLGAQLAAVAPAGFTVSGGDGAVTINDGTSPVVVEVAAIVGETAPSADSVATACCAVLSTFQDHVVLVLTTPWPPSDNPNRCPLPSVDWSADRLRLLFGEPDRPVLELPGTTAAELGLAP